MNTKTYVAIAALAAIALLIGAFTLPGTVSVAEAQGNKVKVNAKQSNDCPASGSGFNAPTCINVLSVTTFQSSG
jgi:hypothetical protein